MNYLFHMLLSGDDDLILVGNFMGDFVKGPLHERFEPRISQGILLHRKIDSFAERHPLCRQSRQRLDARYGRYRGVMVDIFYDYLLINDWERWCDEPFTDFLARSHSVIERHRHTLPDGMQRLVPVIFDELLPSYGSVPGIGSALSRLSRRISRENPLHGGEGELVRHSEGLQSDFRDFAPELFRYAESINSA